MADLHLVLPALNLSTLNAGIFIIMQQVRLMMFSLVPLSRSLGKEEEMSGLDNPRVENLHLTAETREAMTQQYLSLFWSN